MSRAIAIDLCGLPKITDFCCNYFEVLHLPASAYFIRYKVRGGAFDLAVEVTQMEIDTTYHYHIAIYSFTAYSQKNCATEFPKRYSFLSAERGGEAE